MMANAYQDDCDSTAVASRTEVAKVIAQQAKTHRPWLVVVTGRSSVGRMYSLEKTLTVGRAPDCDVRLDEDGISRRHARFGRREDGVVYVQDLESKNGTFVNGERVEKYVLRDGDKIQVGHVSILKFSYQDVLDEALQRNLYESATKDPLTRVANKKSFDDALDREFSYTLRHRTPLSVVIFDVDHFKRINDTFGHPAGDGVLQSIAQLVDRSTRAEDLFARIGGEEFALVLRGLKESDAVLCAERVRRLIESAVFMENHERVPVTISLGVASFSPEHGSPDDLMRAADANLYRAKRDGRNRVASSPPPLAAE